VRRYIELLTELAPGGDSDGAHLILAVDDRGLSDEILDGAARALHRYVDHP
jgi:hypothetical protein